MYTTLRGQSKIDGFDPFERFERKLKGESGAIIYTDYTTMRAHVFKVDIMKI